MKNMYKTRSQNHRIIKLEKTSKVIETNLHFIITISWLQPGKNLIAEENICAQKRCNRKGVIGPKMYMNTVRFAALADADSLAIKKTIP